MPFTFSSNALISSEIFEAFTGLDPLTMTEGEKEIAELLVNAACQQIVQFAGRQFKSGTFTEVWDGQDSDLLIPSEYPITSVTSIKFAYFGGQGTLIDPSLYAIDTSKTCIQFRDGISTTRGVATVEIVYIAGYSSIPPDLQLATLLQYKFLSSLSAGGGMLGLDSISKMQESQRKDSSIRRGGLVSEVVGILESYRRTDAPLSISFARVK